MSIIKMRGPIDVLFAFKIFSLPVPTRPGTRTFWQVPDPSRPEVKNPYPSDPGRHKMDNRPTDSAGNLCGEGENAGKPFTFYFHVTQCAKLNSTSQPCPSTQVKKASMTNQKPIGKGVCVTVSRRLQHLHPGKMISLHYSIVMQTNNIVPWINLPLYVG